MPIKKIGIQSGVSKENTRYTSEGKWYDSDKIRFRKGTPEKLGGWARYSVYTFLGVCRSLWTWVTLTGLTLIGVGTNLKFYINKGGLYYDVTPIRKVVRPMLGATGTGNPFTATLGSNIITVYDTAHGCGSNDFVAFSGAVGLGGNITAALLNQEYQVTVITADTYTITVATTATGTDVAGSPGGGAAVVAAYQVATGLEVQSPAAGWGSGGWGSGGWGTGVTVGTPLQLWSQNNFGESLVFAPAGGAMYYWNASAGLGTSTFTVSSANTDPNYSSVALLLAGNGANGSTTFTDNSPTPKTVTAFGNAQISTAQSKFGGASMAFDGAGDFLSVPASADFYPAASFTVEAWVRPGLLGSTQRIAGFSNASGGESTWTLAQGADNKFTWVAFDGTFKVVTGTTLAVVGAWTHVAGIISGGMMTLYVNGVLEGTPVSIAPLVGLPSPLGIGRMGDFNGQYYQGYIDDFRITQGVARYTANFTPPTQAFPTSAGAGAVPAVLTFTTGPLLLNGTAVMLETTGALPTGLLTYVVYYVINSTTVSGVTTCNLSTTYGGTAITTSGTQSGTHILSNRGIAVTSLGGASNVPIVQNAIFISDTSRFVFALGANEFGTTTQDPMVVRWSDQESVTQWTPSATNQAGSIRLSHGSKIVACLQARQEILIWTDSTLYAFQYVGAPVVWQTQLVGDNISLMGPNAVALASGVVYWMGIDKFYMYDGTVRTLDCDLRKFVYQDINLTQNYQVFAGTNEGFNEVWWFYCAADSTAISNYVIYNYVEKVWYYGTMGRTAWLDSGLINYPIAATYSHNIVNHEFGVDDEETDVTLPIHAYISSSEFDMDDGDHFMFVYRMLPDLSFAGSTAGTTAEVTLGLYAMKNSGSGTGSLVSQPVNQLTGAEYTVTEGFTGQIYTRLRGRQMILKASSNKIGTAWQLGSIRFDVRPDGRR